MLLGEKEGRIRREREKGGLNGEGMKEGREGVDRRK